MLDCPRRGSYRSEVNADFYGDVRHGGGLDKISFDNFGSLLNRVAVFAAEHAIFVVLNHCFYD